jgi:SurA N-terminal domain
MRRSAAKWVRAVAPCALPLVGVLAISGCGSSEGSGSQSTSTTTVTVAGNVPGHTTTAHTATHAAHGSGEVVATVNGAPITHASFQHWLAVTAALSGSSEHSASTSRSVRDRALGFLITQQWVLGEAAARGISVSEADVKKRLEEVDAKQFPKSGELQKYLTRAHETTSDLAARVKLELLEQAISKQVTAGKRTAAERQAALTSLQDAFEKKWRALTTCQAGYVTEDCKQP